MDIEGIEKAVETGLTAGYNQNLELIGNYTGFVDEMREYLLTVNVAQQLLTWNADHKYRIRIEYPVLQYYLNAFAPSKWDTKDIFDMSWTQRRSDHSPTDCLNQKIDLAVVEEGREGMQPDHERTHVGIELKQINTSETAIVKDLERLCKAMIKTDDVSKNSIQLALCGFLRRLDKDGTIMTEKAIKDSIELLAAQWRQKCAGLPQELQSVLEFRVRHFDVRTNASDGNQEGFLAQELSVDEVAQRTGAVIGMIISATRRAPSK